MLQDGSFFSRTYPKFAEFRASVADEVAHNARRLSHHPSLAMVSGNNEGSVWGDVTLYVDTVLATVAREAPHVVVWPSNPSNGWSTLSPLAPRPDSKAEGKYWKRPVAVCERGGKEVH